MAKVDLSITLSHTDAHIGEAVRAIASARAQATGADVDLSDWDLEWEVINAEGETVGVWTDPKAATTHWHAAARQNVQPGVHTVRVKAKKGKDEASGAEDIVVRRPPFGRGEIVPVSISSPIPIDLQRTAIPDTEDLALFEAIKLSTDAISFSNYAAFMNYLFDPGAPLPDVLYVPDDKGRPTNKPTPAGQAWEKAKQEITDDYTSELGKVFSPVGSPLPFPDIEAYRVLKAATEAFLMVSCDVALDQNAVFPTIRSLSASDRDRLGLEPGSSLRQLWNRYLRTVDSDGFIPYLYLVRQKLGDVALADGDTVAGKMAGELLSEILKAKFSNPCLLELIWSYWHEEGMLVQTMGALSMRFQNRRGPAEVDPLANIAIDPLRPLSNLLWGYIQDEQHRLSVARRAYEYDHEYGITLMGRAVPAVRGADTRSNFLAAFHNLLHRASIFYKEDDDTTMIADPFPVLNALRDVHLLLAEGAHNAYGDLPWTARHEMLMQQWILSRPEFREFLPARIMVVYPEPWMERVDAMKRLQGWTDTSVRFFHDLGVFGEQILLSIRFGNWSAVFDRQQAANWARFWRQEAQWYIHAYQTVTGVDLSADMADVRQAEQAEQRATQPAFHLQRRLVQQQRTRQVGVSQVRQPAALPESPTRARP
jgi:hypothetical protein